MMVSVIFLKTGLIPINVLTDLRCKHLSDNFTIVSGIWNLPSGLSFSLTKTEKMAMFRFGNECSERVINGEIITVRPEEFSTGM